MAAVEEEQQVVWRGAEALRPFLVPIDSLEPFPGNPRLGDVARIRKSLQRFGQVKPLLVDGQRIVAHHHVRLAAIEEGYTHVAAIPNEFADEDEARAYMLADNRTSDLGTYDDEALVAHLRHLDELDALDGTGYGRDDYDDILARVRKASDADPPPMPRSDTPREQRDKHVKELVLLYGEAQLAQLEVFLGIVAHEKGTSGPSETIYAAAEIAATLLNQGK